MDAWCDGKPHRPEELGNILVPRGGYNEVIIDTRSILSHLPDVILAFYYLGDGGDANGWARDAFLDHYQLGDDRAPLVRLDLYNGASSRPFSFG